MTYEPPARQLFDGVYCDREDRLYTRNMNPGRSVYDEPRVTDDRGIEYRHWHPGRSKLAAMVLAGAKQFPLGRKTRLLYLGAADGTTVSHISDIAVDGVVYAVEFSPRPFRKLIGLAKERENIVPILADARHPERYRAYLGTADLLYQDIAQRDQPEIFIANLDWYLAPTAVAILMIKARSIDVSAPPKKVFGRVERKLRDTGLQIIDGVELAPFEKDHKALVVQREDA